MSDHRHTGTTAAVRRFFKDNPGEELTYDDMRVKFDLSDRELYRLAREMRKEGLVEVVHVVRGIAPCKSS